MGLDVDFVSVERELLDRYPEDNYPELHEHASTHFYSRRGYVIRDLLKTVTQTTEAQAFHPLTLEHLDTLEGYLKDLERYRPGDVWKKLGVLSETEYLDLKLIRSLLPTFRRLITDTQAMAWTYVQ